MVHLIFARPRSAVGLPNHSTHGSVDEELSSFPASSVLRRVSGWVVSVDPTRLRFGADHAIAAHSWWSLLLARFLLGFAVGAKSTTTPVYGAECAPATIRGALVMMWQMCM
jgi:MFS family permease